MEIKYGGIYKCDDGLYRLIIGDVFQEKQEELFVYTSLDRDEKNIFNVEGISLEHPNEKWHFTRMATKEEFKQALKNFRAIMSKEPYFDENYDYNKGFGKTSM